MQIFISYSRKDIDFIRRLAGDLETAGYEVWWDVSDLRGGDDWVRVIPAAIRASEAFVVVLSPNSVVSEWVEKEYTQALILRRKIIPIMLAKTDVPFALNTINYIDFTSKDYAGNLKKLLDALGYTGKPIVPAPAPRPLQAYAIPIVISILLVLAVLAGIVFSPSPEPDPTATPSMAPSFTPVVIPTQTDMDTPTSTDRPTITSTVTVVLTLTATTTPTPTLIPSPTNQPFEVLIYCVNSLYANSINVRSGPGTIYAPTGEPLHVGRCLGFSARNEEGTWLQVAPVQTDSTLQQYAGAWIYRELLGLGTTGPIDLPAVTLTPTPLPTDTPTITPTFTPTETPSPTETETPTPT